MERVSDLKFEIFQTVGCLVKTTKNTKFLSFFVFFAVFTAIQYDSQQKIIPTILNSLVEIKLNSKNTQFFI